MRNPLFPNTNRHLQEVATSAFRQTELGQLVQQLDRLKSSGRITERELRDIYARTRRAAQNRSSITTALAGTPVGQLIGQVDRYAKGGMKETILNALFDNLGPVGGLMKGLLRPSGRQVAPTTQNELDIAADLLRTFGYNVNEPGQRRELEQPSGSGTRSRSTEQQAKEATEFLESLGFTVTPPSPEDSKPPKRMKRQDIPGRVRLWVDNREFTVPKGDPLITGEMVPVESSNVHSIGYIWNGNKPESGTLKVRFLDKRKNGPKSGKGATYHYFDVHPTLFLAFQNAASKGKWVWDNLRIRGTVAGHQKRYQLARLASDGYVPRAATRLGNEEWYLPRTVQGANGRSYKSELGAQLVQRLNDARANDGGPNRGTPNRGR